MLIGSNTTMAKRLRVYEDEVTPVMRAIRHRHAAMEPVEDQAEAAVLFKVLWRLKENRRGPPHYPEINPQTIKELLEEARWLTQSRW
jgi:hypothetical protein